MRIFHHEPLILAMLDILFGFIGHLCQLVMDGMPKVYLVGEDIADGLYAPAVFYFFRLPLKHGRLIPVPFIKPPCWDWHFIFGEGVADFLCPIPMCRKLKNTLHNPLRFLINNEPVLFRRMQLIP